MKEFFECLTAFVKLLRRVAASSCAARVAVLVKAGRDCVSVAVDHAVVSVAADALILWACACGRACAGITHVRRSIRVSNGCRRASGATNPED